MHTIPTDRVWGATRYETSTAVAEKYFKGATVGVVAYGVNFPDGLCGGALAKAMNAPLILTANGKTDAAVKFAKANGMKDGIVLGGPALVSDDSVKAVFQLGKDDKIIVK